MTSMKEKERILLGHSEKLAVAFGLINTNKEETIRITKNSDNKGETDSSF